MPEGHYRGKKAVAAKPGADPVVVEQLSRVELTIKPNGDAVFIDGGLPYEGQITRRGDGLHFETLAVMGINISKQPAEVPRSLEFKMNKNGSIAIDGTALTKMDSP